MSKKKSFQFFPFPIPTANRAKFLNKFMNSRCLYVAFWETVMKTMIIDVELSHKFALYSQFRLMKGCHVKN